MMQTQVPGCTVRGVDWRKNETNYAARVSWF
jgi:hypothetical protein